MPRELSGWQAGHGDVATPTCLFSMMKSANATCIWLSLQAPSAFFSSRCLAKCLVSTTVTMPSRYSWTIAARISERSAWDHRQARRNNTPGFQAHHRARILTPRGPGWRAQSFQPKCSQSGRCATIRASARKCQHHKLAGTNRRFNSASSVFTRLSRTEQQMQPLFSS